VAARFDIFSGTHRGDRALWIDSVNDLEAAKQRMLSIATGNPGKYFIFSTSENRIVVEIETKSSFMKR
jgi:hypothetical protein